jgi:hypothetical protein
MHLLRIVHYTLIDVKSTIFNKWINTNKSNIKRNTSINVYRFEENRVKVSVSQIHTCKCSLILIGHILERQREKYLLCETNCFYILTLQLLSRIKMAITDVVRASITLVFSFYLMTRVNLYSSHNLNRILIFP